MSVVNKVNVISSIGYDSKIYQKLSYDRQESIAGVFSTFAHSWITCGPELFVVNNSDGVLLSYWTFGENLQDDLEITCAVELPLEGCAIPLLILGISSENVNLICFFNPNTRKILRAIDIIYPVRTICIIEDGTNEVYPLNDTLTPTEGLLAVGCADGTILLIDLCRSILCKAVNGDFRFYSTEENPSEVVYVGINLVTSGGFSQKIVESRKKKNCVSVILTDASDEGVTALLYSIESAVLFVGTSSGSFHLWNMSSLSCLYKSPGTNRAIVSLSLLEPCDDPRHSLYLWICFEQYAQVAMYCISFSSKFFVHGYGVYYQNFESAGLVYRFTLGMEVDVIAKRPICSQAIAKLVPKNLVRCISLPEAEGTHLRLFITAYEIIDKGQVSIRAVLFDLNQWYRDQMPEEGVSACLDSIDLDSKSLWHLQLEPSSLTLYQCVRPQEQHFHPTAFDFRIWCIEEEGVRCLEKLGLQTQWLRNMSRMGSKALIEPTQVFLGALAAGLLPSFIDPPDPEANNEVEERSYVLTICLENRMIMVIEDCVKDWNSGGYTVRGCTIQFLLDWLWNLHRIYKTNGNKICIPLFDQSGMKFDVSEKRSLQHCKSLLNTVQSVYTKIVNRYKNNIIISGVEEKLTAMSLVRLYFDCCLKLISVNLLPEPNDLGRPIDSVVYHFDDINTYAVNRRKAGPFLGDSLLGRTQAEKQWLEEGGTGLYPPPTIQSVLRFCLHPAPSIANKMSLLLYLFMDIVNFYTPIRSQPVIDRIKNFQHLMRIPEVQYKIVAGCWYFDHSMFDEGVDLLFDPRVLCVDLNEDQHRGILHLLASEGQEKLALQYLRLKSPTLNMTDDLRMELNLLLSNGLVNEAFLFQRKHPELRETLLIEFFEGCIERKQLGQVFGLNLDFKEEAALMKYLKSSGLKEKGDLQVLLLLSKAKYTEAMFLNDKLNSSINGPKSRLETDTRDMIVRGITGSLNTISRHMANEMKTYRPPPSGSHPRPLSSLIKVRNGPDGPICQTDSKVLLSAVAKSTRHLSDFVNSFESGHRRKREEKDSDVEFDHEPSRKRLKFWDSNNDITVPSLKGKWLTSSCEPSSVSQERDVMELVGTPLVKKRGKRFSPQSKPSSILKGKTPEKSITTEDFCETPKKTIRFTLPENEVQISGRKPLRDNETSLVNSYPKIKVNNEDESATPVKEELSKPSALGKPSARKSLHSSDNLNNSEAVHGASSVIESIRDRLRSSAKKKVLEDGVNWHEVAEASKPRILFTQGVSKINAVTKSDNKINAVTKSDSKINAITKSDNIIKADTTQSSTPTSQALLDITVTSSEKKYLDSPSRKKEISPVTETLFNTTLLPKVLFSNITDDKEMAEKSPQVASIQTAFLERYKQLRNKNIKSSNSVFILEEGKEKDARFEDKQSLRDACTEKTVELIKTTKAATSINVVIDEETLIKKSMLNENISKENKPLSQQKNNLELCADQNEANNDSLLGDQELKSSGIPKESLSPEIESLPVSMNEQLFQNIENSNDINNVLPPYKDEDDVTENQEQVTGCCDSKVMDIEGNEENIDNPHDVGEYQENLKESQICLGIDIDNDNCFNQNRTIEALPSEKSNNENSKDENDLINEKRETSEKEEESADYQSDVTKSLIVNDKSKEVYSDIKKDCEEIIDIASDDEDGDNEDKQSYHESLSDEESERISGESSEEIEEEMSEKEEEIGSENEEESLPDVSSISSDGEDVQHSDESISVECHSYKSTKKKIRKNLKVDNKKRQTETTPIYVLSDDSGDEASKNKNKVSNVKTGESKKNSSPRCRQHYDDVSDSEVFGLNTDKSDGKEEENSEDDMWIGLDDNESSINKHTKESKQDDSYKKTENFQKSVPQHNLGIHEKGSKKCNLNPFHYSKNSINKSLTGTNHSNIIKEDAEHILSDTNIDISENKIVPEISVLYGGVDSDEHPIISNSVSETLIANELITNSKITTGMELKKDSPSVNLSEYKLVTENQQEGNCFAEFSILEKVSSTVEIPVIERVTSLTEERPEMISEDEMLAEENESIPLPSVLEIPSHNNEDEYNKKLLGERAEDLDLKEDYQSIERNWTEQIEEEMKQDIDILEIKSDNNDSINICNQELLIVDGSKKLADSFPINKSDLQDFENSTVVSSLQTLEVKHHQNNFLVSKELKNLSERLKIGGDDFSIKSTANLFIGDDALHKKVYNINNPGSAFAVSEKNIQDGDLIIDVGTNEGIVRGNLVFPSDEPKLPQDKTEEVGFGIFEKTNKVLEKQFVISKENDSDEKNKIESINKSKDCDNSEIPLLNPGIDNQKTTEGDCHILNSKYNTDSKPSEVHSLEENLLKHSDDSFQVVSSGVALRDISSGNTVNDTSSSIHQSVLNKLEKNTSSNNNGNLSRKTVSDNGNLSREKNASFLIEKRQIPSENLSHINFVSVEGEANKSCKNIIECIGKSLYFEQGDVLESLQDKSHISLKVNKDDDVNFGKSPVSKSNILINTRLIKHDEDQRSCDFNEAIKSNNSEKSSVTCSEAGDVSVMNIEASDKVENNNFDRNYEIKEKNIDNSVPNSSHIDLESIQMTNMRSMHEDANIKPTANNKVLVGSKLEKDNITLTRVVKDSVSNSCVPSSLFNVAVEKNYENPVEAIDSFKLVPLLEEASNNILIVNSNKEENVTILHPDVCETDPHEGQEVIQEKIAFCVDKDKSDIEPLDHQLNNAKIEVCNDSYTAVTVSSLQNIKNNDLEKNSTVSSTDNNPNISSVNTAIEKSFFFGKEDIGTYIRSTKATFQIGGRMSLPEEEEPIDPMEVAMIEDDEKMLSDPSPSEPDIDLSLHLSPDHLRKPKKVDQGIVTDNSYLQRRARKLRKSFKKLETDECTDKKFKNKIINKEAFVSSIPSDEKELKCISTQTSDGVLDEVDSSESEEGVIDSKKVSGPSQKSEELKKKVIRKMRQSSEPPLTHKEESNRNKKLSQRLLQEKDVKGILKNKDIIENFYEELKTKSKTDQLPVRRSRRLSECITETDEHLRNQCDKDDHLKSQRRYRGYSEEPNVYKEHDLPALLDKHVEKGKVHCASSNIDDDFTKRRRSKRISGEPDFANKHCDNERRYSKNSDDYHCDLTNFKHSEETEIRSILKKTIKGNRKTSLSCEMINELNKDNDSGQVSRKLRSQSEEPESHGIPKKKYRQSRRSSCTYETAVDFHCQIEEIPVNNKKIHRSSDGTEIQGILKKRSSYKSRSSPVSNIADELHHKVDQSEETYDLRKHSEMEIQEIIKKRRNKECKSSDYETKSKQFEDVFPARPRKARRHSEEPEMLKNVKRRERRCSQSSDVENDINPLESHWEGVRQMRRHSEEPEIQVISQKRRVSRKSLYATGTANDFCIPDDHSYESKKSQDKSEESNIKGILKKSKSNQRRNSCTGETEKGLIHLESCSSDNKNSHFFDYDSLKAGQKMNKISRSNQTNLYISALNDKNGEESTSLSIVKIVADVEPNNTSEHASHSRLKTVKKDTDDLEDKQMRDSGNKVSDSLSSKELISENKRARRLNLPQEEECQSVKESPAKVRRRSSSVALAKEEPVDKISLPEVENKSIRKSLRKTPDKREDNIKEVIETKLKSGPENLKFVPKRLDYSDDDESPKQKKCRSLIDFPIKRNSRLPRPALEDIREEDEDLSKKKKKSLDDFHIEEMKKKASSKKKSISKLVIGDSDGDSDVSTPELWKKDSSKEKRLTRMQQKLFLMNQQLTSITEVESPSTSSSPRRNVRKKADASDSPLKTPTRSSLRLQKKPPSENE